MVRMIPNCVKIVHKYALHANRQHSVQYVRVQRQWQLIKCVTKTATLHTNIITTTHVSNYVPMAHIWHTRMSTVVRVRLTVQHVRKMQHDAFHAKANTCLITRVWWSVHRIILVIKILNANCVQIQQITQHVCYHWTLVPKWRYRITSMWFIWDLINKWI